MADDFELSVMTALGLVSTIDENPHKFLAVGSFSINNVAV
jgi:hypothetical protein